MAWKPKGNTLVKLSVDLVHREDEASGEGADSSTLATQIIELIFDNLVGTKLHQR
jgi:hypothetical protein